MKKITDHIKEIIDRSAKVVKKDFKAQVNWRPVKALAKKLDISERATLIFAYAYFYTLTKKSFTPLDISEEVHDSPFEIGAVLEIIRDLQRINFITDDEAYVNDNLSVLPKVVSDITLNIIPEKKDLNKNKSLFELSDELLNIFWFRTEGLGSFSDFYDELDVFLETYKNFKPIIYLEKKKIPQSEWLIFLYTYLSHLQGEATANLKTAIQTLYKGINNQFEVRSKLNNQESHLFKKGVVEYDGEVLKSTGKIKLSESAMTEIFGSDLEIVMSNINDVNVDNSLIEPDIITERKLYYNEKEEKQVTTVRKIIDQKKFEDIQKKLNTSGYRSGVCILLHGSPGTGKTETVYQLAKSSKRKIMKVDISSIRDKFIGESEKNLSGIFKKYEELRRSSKNTPILLFNEADALFNKRINATQSSDLMNNSMQNIILEELENFKGLLFATTNLILNMDKAFERRFLYKVQFEKPGSDMRSAIWKSHFPNINSEQLAFIATKYDLSGGQIENVVRKLKLDNLINEKDFTFEQIDLICNEEIVDRSNNNRSHIGFKSTH